MNERLAKLGGVLGIVYCLVGLFLVFLGWNGAASYDRLSAQVPYLISGGLIGLSLVIIGTGLIVAQSGRADRAALRAQLAAMSQAVEGLASAGGAGAGAGVGSSSSSVAAGDDLVVAGANSYHRSGCRLVEGQFGLVNMTPAAASSSGRAPCRVCQPATVAA